MEVEGYLHTHLSKHTFKWIGFIVSYISINLLFKSIL